MNRLHYFVLLITISLGKAIRFPLLFFSVLEIRKLRKNLWVDAEMWQSSPLKASSPQP